jgi:hypothetical protein
VNLSQLASDVAKNLNRHAPTILTVAGSVGVIATAYYAHKAGEQSALAIREATEEKLETEQRLLTGEEKVKLTWQNYILPTSIGMATLACFIASNVVSTKRQATIVGAAALGNQALQAYREKLAEQLGSDVEQEIREEFVKEQASTTKLDPKLDRTTLIGEQIFLDTFSGQQFKSSTEVIREALDQVNLECHRQGYASLNYFYDLIGARTTKIGEIMGWTREIPLDVDLIDITMDVMGENVDAVAIDYRHQPNMEYYRVW